MSDHDLRDAYATLKQTYHVENLILPTSRYAFVLESPHVEELKYGVPVAGRSGRSMTRIIFEGDRSLPLGRLLLAYQSSNEEHAFFAQGQRRVVQFSPAPPRHSLHVTSLKAPSAFCADLPDFEY